MDRATQGAGPTSEVTAAFGKPGVGEGAKTNASLVASDQIRRFHKLHGLSFRWSDRYAATHPILDVSNCYDSLLSIPKRAQFGNCRALSTSVACMSRG